MPLIESCQNWNLAKLKWFQHFLLNVSILMNWIENCQNWKWFQYFLLKASMYFWWIELKIARIESCQNLNVTNWKLPKLKVAKNKSCQDWEFPILKVAKDESEFSIAKLPNCQVAKLPSCHIAKLQVARLWTCDYGAKSLLFLFF